MPPSSRAPVESITRGSECGMKGSVTGSEPAAMIAFSKVTVLVPPPFGCSTTSSLGEAKRPTPLTTVTLRALARPGEAAGQALDHAVLPVAELVEVDLRGGEGDAVAAHVDRLVHHLGGVEEGLGGDAADIEAHPAQGRPALDQHHLLAEVGGAEGGGVAAGAGAQHQHLGVEVALGPGRRPWRRGPLPAGAARLRLGAGLKLQDQVALGDLVALLDLELGHRARGRRGHVHRGLVALQRQQRFLRLDLGARSDVNLDDLDTLVVADVRDLDLDRLVVPGGEP